MHQPQADACLCIIYLLLLLCSGHFDILMGKRVETEVFPLIHQFLLQHDSPRSRL
jgi:poly-beta-hydroxyalkanoate depolymerase